MAHGDTNRHFLFSDLGKRLDAGSLVHDEVHAGRVVQIQETYHVLSRLLVRFDALGSRDNNRVGGDTEVAGTLFHVQDVGETATGEESHIDIGVGAGNSLTYCAHAHIPCATGGGGCCFQFGVVLCHDGGSAHGGSHNGKRHFLENTGNLHTMPPRLYRV